MRCMQVLETRLSGWSLKQRKIYSEIQILFGPIVREILGGLERVVTDQEKASKQRAQPSRVRKWKLLSLAWTLILPNGFWYKKHFNHFLPVFFKNMHDRLIVDQNRFKILSRPSGFVFRCQMDIIIWDANVPDKNLTNMFEDFRANFIFYRKVGQLYWHYSILSITILIFLLQQTKENLCKTASCLG